ncbi:hypothetical protein NQ318_014428 [Aromia moschata]|uniref:Tc1-like transposase DDE domain-containing protein n=1 Tax=Aromia moschata TaxID=1265417 RepID=A0AAV8Y698_9CUCU|nr:hypothetical protein NQ318_014428 [Aromia moschata]
MEIDEYCDSGNWPPRNVDLNPIAHLWDHMNRQLRNNQPLPALMDDVENIIREIWTDIDQDLIDIWFQVWFRDTEQKNTW